MIQALAFIDSPEQLLLILAIALLFFGPTKLPQLGSSLGKAIRAYKDGVNSEDEPAPTAAAAVATVPAQCPKCGAAVADGSASFCTRCGMAFSAATA